MERPLAGTGTRLRCLVRALAVSSVVAGALLAGPSLAAGASDYFCYRFAEYAHRVVVDPDGRIYVAGFTHTADLPAATSVPEPPAAIGTDPYFIGFFFVSALAPDGSPLWTSYLPGFSGSKGVRGLAVGSDGYVWLAGGGMYVPAGSAPTPFDGSHVVLAKFAADGTLVFAENVGGSGSDAATDVALTQEGDAIVVGLTNSDDFPGASSKGGYYADDGAADAFVARIRADGSGPMWTRRFGGPAPSGPTRCDMGGVLVDTDGTIVVNFVAPRDAAHVPQGDGLPLPPGSDIDRVPAEERTSPMYVVRLDATGATSRAARLGFMGAFSVDMSFDRRSATIAFDHERNVLVGGMRAAARLASDLTTVRSAWTNPWWRRYSSSARFCVDVDDSVLLLRDGDAIYSLRDGEPPALADDPSHLYVHDLALDAEGDRVLLGDGEGAPFHVAFERDVGPDQLRYTTWAAKYPRLGIAGPRNLRLEAVGTGFVDLAWDTGPDPAVRYDVETNLGSWFPPAPVPVDGSATSARVEGLVAATWHTFRLVTEFANGVRIPLYLPNERYVRTLALPPSNVVVTDGPDRRVDVDWTDTNDGRSEYVVEQRVGNGEWVRLLPTVVQGTHFEGLVPDVALPLAYRVRGDYASDVPSEAQFLPLQPTLRLVVTEGRLADDARNRGVFTASGTIESTDASMPLAFDPATQYFFLTWGQAEHPIEFRFGSDPAWTVSDGVYRCSVARTRQVPPLRRGSEVVLDIAHGTFRIDLRLTSRLIPRGTYFPWSGQFALNLAWGPFSGGSIDAWQHTLRPRESWNGNAALPVHRLPAAAWRGAARRDCRRTRRRTRRCNQRGAPPDRADAKASLSGTPAPATSLAT
jgi:hypothetical protein